MKRKLCAVALGVLTISTAAWGQDATTTTETKTEAKPAASADLEEGKVAPNFSLKTQDNQDFSLSSRKGKGWTVLYFYPKADSPGCTEQACAFRNTIERIKKQNAVLIGISADSQADQKAFHSKNQLNFDLLSDADTKVIESYGLKRPLFGIAKRWTFIVDPDLVIRSIERDVDPAFDAEWTAATLEELQNPPPENSEDPE